MDPTHTGELQFARDLAEDCAACGTPLAGVLGLLLRPFGIRRSGRNPNFCSRCQIHVDEGTIVELTVLFADLTDFTTMTQDLGPERTHAVTNAFLAMASSTIARHHGYIDKYIGDAVMALFNVPVRSSNHAALAVEAALEIQAALPALSRSQGIELSAGIGIATGYARAGRLGSSDRGDFTVMGNVVNLAARLEGRAGSGDVLVDAGVHAAVAERFADAAAEALDLKGFAGPVIARRLRATEPRPGALTVPARSRRGLRWRIPAAALALLGAPCATATLLGPAVATLGAASVFAAVAAPVLKVLDQAAIRWPLLVLALFGTALNLAALARVRALEREARQQGLGLLSTPGVRWRARLVLASAVLSLAVIAGELWAHQRGHGVPW